MLVLAYCSPVYEDAALNELATTLGARLVARPVAGLLVLECGQSLDEVAARIAAQPPIFTRHLVLDVTLLADGGGVDRVAAQVGALPITARAGTVLVWDGEGRIGPEEHAVRARLLDLRAGRAGGQVDTAAPALLVAHAAETWFAGTALLGAGLALPRDLLRQRYASGRPGRASGRPDLAAHEVLVSRSAFKLLEALETFGIVIRPGQRALDLGAAPGGWTQVLAGHGAQVTAVDPALLDPRVARLPGVTCAAMTAQAYFRVAQDRFDLIVNDMRLDARESARLMVEAAALLRPGGVGLLTLKLPERAPTTPARQALATLSRGYLRRQARCLFHNRHEVTVCLTDLRRAPEHDGPPVRQPAPRRQRPRSG